MIWDGKGNAYNILPSGIYFIYFNFDNNIKKIKVVMLQ
jgi:hypothetical protein